MKNTVTSKFMAIVDGKSTGLAGCHNTLCANRNDCLRADQQLQQDYNFHHKDELFCTKFIPIFPVVAE